MPTASPIIETLNAAQPLLLPIGLFVIVTGILLVVAHILDARKADREGRAMQISAVPGAMVFGVGIILIGAGPAMSFAMSAYK